MGRAAPQLIGFSPLHSLRFWKILLIVSLAKGSSLGLEFVSLAASYNSLLFRVCSDLSAFLSVLSRKINVSILQHFLK